MTKSQEESMCVVGLECLGGGWVLESLVVCVWGGKECMLRVCFDSGERIFPIVLVLVMAHSSLCYCSS